MFLLAHHDHAAALDRYPVDEDLVARVDVVGERLQPTFALGAELVFVVASDLATFTHGVDDVAGPEARRGNVADRATCPGEICAAVCFTFFVA